MTKPFGSLTDDEVQHAGRVELRRVVVTDDVESWDLLLYTAGGIEPIAVDAFSLDELNRINPPSSRDLADGVAKVVLGCHGLRRTEPWTMSRDAAAWTARVAPVPVAASEEAPAGG
ncbi:hypothetical protein [Agromyces kandeliae]|uniref:Uncharacterized protein n=1 Tax=Agromyces kandeliae TaxID=2666141 RepID=A0A6L5R1G4_9MICO|nr:hypothetical protein [Agromyces kandeliae]MRX43853.1 hypothetical protein [Agromyces kandeliae]